MIIDFNRYNGGGGSGSGSTDLTNFWNSAVTEQHIESAASITYASAVSYTDAALSGFTPAGNSNILAAISSQTEYDAISGSVKTGDLIQVWDVDINGDEENETGLFQANVNEWEDQGVITRTIEWERKDNEDSLMWADKYYPWMADNDVWPVDFGAGGFLISLAEGGYNGIGFDDEGKAVITHIVPEEDEQTGEVTGMTREDRDILGELDTLDEVVSQALVDLNDRVDDMKPDVIYEAQGSDPGFYAINSSALTTWQIENLDLSPYKFVRFYIKASDIGFNSSDNFTAPMYVDVVLDPKSLSSQYQAYLGVTTNICAGNRNRSFHTVAAVDITKSKVQLLYQTTLWDISVSSAANNGRYCYKIEGFKYDVCGPGPQGEGGQTYTAGSNINISAAGVISVSGLSTINGSAITDGGNLVIQSPYMSGYYTSGQTDAAISAATQDMVTSTDVRQIVKLTQSAYDQLVLDDDVDPNTFYIIVNNI